MALRSDVLALLPIKRFEGPLAALLVVRFTLDNPLEELFSLLEELRLQVSAGYIPWYPIDEAPIFPYDGFKVVLAPLKQLRRLELLLSTQLSEALVILTH